LYQEYIYLAIVSFSCGRGVGQRVSSWAGLQLFLLLVAGGVSCGKENTVLFVVLRPGRVLLHLLKLAIVKECS
jgi:hypothetical protein